jgi:hypothetical protein
VRFLGAVVTTALTAVKIVQSALEMGTCVTFQTIGRIFAFKTIPQIGRHMDVKIIPEIIRNRGTSTVFHI